MRSSSLLVMLCLSALTLVGLLISGPFSQAYALAATVDINPDTLNVNMNGRWITVFITLPDGHNASEIDVSTILLEHLFQVQWSQIEGQVLMVKFDASSVTDYLLVKLYHLGVGRAQVDLMVEGKLNDGTSFAGEDTITVMDPPWKA